jgi:SAM-dependent methyltransferase
MTRSVPLPQRWVRRLAARRACSWLFSRVLRWIDRFVLRITGGRRTATAVLAGLTVVRLTTTGGRTGLPEEVWGRVIEVYPGAAAFRHRPGDRTMGVFCSGRGPRSMPPKRPDGDEPVAVPSDRRARSAGTKGWTMLEPAKTRFEDSFSGRTPTSHERLSGKPWDASYEDGPAPWDIGRPQPVIVRVAADGGFSGAVLDAGCGTGDNALHVATLGLPVLGVDVAETAVAIARAKAAERGLDAEFEAADAFRLDRLRRRFETVMDCGLFHTCDAEERPRYAMSLASVVRPGGALYVLCFSDEGADTGPHPVSQDQLRAAFTAGNGWVVTAIRPERVLTRFHDDGAPGWLATMRRIQHRRS